MRENVQLSSASAAHLQVMVFVVARLNVEAAVYDRCMLITLVVYYVPGANKFYREQLMCREQEPWLFRGGLLGEIQVLSS